MLLTTFDWTIIALFIIVSLAIGLWTARSASKNINNYFLSGNNMPWWILGISMVATTFSADTPNLVTDIVRKNGISGNWAWWAFLLTGMLTVFVYAKLWRRSGIVTDLEFYDLRYSGQAASFLRMFRAVYLGVIFNTVIMGTVLLAGIKMASILMGLSPVQTVTLISVVTVIYSMLGGLRAVILTDFFQFFFSMAGMVIAAYYIVHLPQIGGLQQLLTHEEVLPRTSFIPDLNDWDSMITLLIMPIAVQWWSVWYPGAEPGGGGYIAQRMLSAKNEEDAVKSTLLFNFAHYVLRPWPWILIALASLVIFPDLNAIQEVFPHIEASVIGDDLAFPAMLSLLPEGLIGLLVAALISALMSTLSTHLNWGASYIVNDLVRPLTTEQPLSEKKLILISRVATFLLMVLSAFMALYVLREAKEAFDLILMIGAGTGLVFILRWFWWRVNAQAEIVAMVVSFIMAVFFAKGYEGSMPGYAQTLIAIGVTSLCWIAACYLFAPTSQEKLTSFYRKIRPFSWGWQGGIDDTIIQDTNQGKSSLGSEIAMMLLGCVGIYAGLFAVGYALYGKMIFSTIFFAVLFICGFMLAQIWKRNKAEN